jgi:hypothetical protein
MNLFLGQVKKLLPMVPERAIMILSPVSINKLMVYPWSANLRRKIEVKAARSP